MEYDPLRMRTAAVRMPKILVADDDVLVHKLVAAALAEMSYEVMAARDGAEALQLIDEARPDLVVLDINMPHKDGWEVLHELRSQADTRSLPVIMLTGYSDTKSQVLGLNSGADDYIAKPFDLNELRVRVASVLRRCASA